MDRQHHNKTRRGEGSEPETSCRKKRCVFHLTHPRDEKYVNVSNREKVSFLGASHRIVLSFKWATHVGGRATRRQAELHLRRPPVDSSSTRFLSPLFLTTGCPVTLASCALPCVGVVNTWITTGIMAWPNACARQTTSTAMANDERKTEDNR